MLLTWHCLGMCFFLFHNANHMSVFSLGKIVLWRLDKYWTPICAIMISSKSPLHWRQQLLRTQFLNCPFFSLLFSTTPSCSWTTLYEMKERKTGDTCPFLTFFVLLKEKQECFSFPHYYCLIFITWNWY